MALFGFDQNKIQRGGRVSITPRRRKIMGEEISLLTGDVMSKPAELFSRQALLRVEFSQK